MWLWRATSKSPNIPISAWNKHADLLERSLTGPGTTNDPHGLTLSPQHQSEKLFGVTASVDGYYPAADENPDTYWVRFSSAIFTGVPPVGVLDEMDSETAPIPAHISPASTNAPYLTEGTKVLVVSINGCWWIIPETAAAIRYGLLRTDLEPGYSCIIEEREWTVIDEVKSLECNGKTFRAFDPLGEFYGNEDEACVTWIVDPNGPTADDLDELDITLPEGAGEPTETEVASLQRITCPGFECSCSNVPPPVT